MVNLGIGWIPHVSPVYPFPTQARIKWLLVDASSDDTRCWGHIPAQFTNVIWEAPWEFQSDPTGGFSGDSRAWYSNPTKVKKYFDLIVANKSKAWTHAPVLCQDETYCPATMTGWKVGTSTGMASMAPLREYDTTIHQAILPNGTATGVALRSIKKWYIDTGKGTAAQFDSWWGGLVAKNNANINDETAYRDTTFLDWNFNEWVNKVYKAWHALCHSIGKKSFHVGFINYDETLPASSLPWNWGSQLTWVGTNIDAIAAYNFPKTLAEANNGTPLIMGLVRPIVKKTLVWIVSVKWGVSGDGSFDPVVQYADYTNAVADADVMMMHYYSDIGDNSILSGPRLITFCTNSNTCPTSCNAIATKLTIV